MPSYIADNIEISSNSDREDSDDENLDKKNSNEVENEFNFYN